MSNITDHIAIDFETFYDDECSVRALGNHNYVRHPAFEVSLVGIFAEDFQYVGDVANAPWDKLDGSRIVVAHNSAFEIEIIRYLKRTHQIPEHVTEVIEDTAAVCRFLNVAGSLAFAIKGLYGEERSKTIRDKDMKGKTLRTVSSELQEAVKAYGLQDAEDCWRIWSDFSELWPDVERRAWWHSFRMLDRGVHVDVDKLERYIDHLGNLYHECLNQMPWVAKGKPPGSPKAVRELCRELGIEIPTSFDRSQPDVKRWIDLNSDKPWVQAFMDHKCVNGFRNKLLSMRDRLDNGILYYDMIYGGTRTLRWAGGGGYNILNQRREEVYGCEERSLLIPPPGKKFVIADYCQIEPRILFCEIGGKEEVLDLIRRGMSVYEAYARAVGRWKEPGILKKENPKLYGDVKSDVLGLGYGMGAFRYRAKLEEDTGVLYPQAEVQARINQFRYRENPTLPPYWKRLEAEMKANRGCDVFRRDLRSGRPIYYYNLRIDPQKGRVVVPKELGSSRNDWLWGGMCVENVIQATARDVLRDNGLLATEEAGIECNLHVYDEGVYCIDAGSKESEESQKREIMEIMSKPLDWMPELPLEVEADIHEHYTK